MATINKSIEELVKTLEDPLSHKRHEIEYAMRSLHDNVIPSMTISYSAEFVVLTKKQAFTIYIDTGSRLLSKTTNIFHLSGNDIRLSLDKHFRYPLLPTEEERTLFEIEFGIQYPLKANKVAEGYLNSNIQTN